MSPAAGIAAFLAYLRQTRYHPATIGHYARQLRLFAAWLAAQSIDDLRRLTRTHIDAYQIQVRQQSISLDTQGLRLRAVKRLYQYLVAQGRLVIDPTDATRDPRRREALPRPVLGLDEMRRLLLAPDVTTHHGVRDRALLEVLYATGIRVGELQRTRVDDVDMEAQTLLVRHAKTRIPRVVPLGAQAMHWLSRYLHEVRPAWAACTPVQSLFVTEQGGVLRHPRIRVIVYRCRRVAGIRKRVSPHVLRHSCATHLMQAGAHLRVIQELLGHSHLASTVLYTRVTPIDIKATHARYHPGSKPHAAG